jgi:uncharacterized protein (TIRG00374 family)
LKKHISSAIKLGISLGLGIGLIYWFVGQMSDSDKQHVLEDVKRANYLWVLSGPLLGFVSNIFRAQRWRLLLRPTGHNPGFLNTTLSVMIMYFLNLFIPRAGEVSRCAILARYENVPLEKSIGTMVVERLMDVVCISLLALILLVVERDKFLMLYDKIITNSKSTFGDIIAKYQVSPAMKYGVLVLLVFGAVAFIAIQLRNNGIEKIIATLKERVAGLWQGLISIKDLESPGMFLLHTILIWGSYFITSYFAFFMFPETSGLSLAAAGVCLFFSGVAFSLTPGGLGLYPIFMSLILGLYGITGSAGISLGWVTWTAQTAAVLLCGVVSLIVIAIINREPSLKDVTTKS